VEQCLPEEQGGRCGGDQVSVRARAYYRVVKANAEGTMIEKACTD
jgi:hypothetical protein